MNEPVTDRELLELAALAAEYDVVWHDTWKCFEHRKQINTTNPPTLAGQRHVWVPLEDDGDALRLAVNRSYSVKYHDALGQALVRSHLGETVENIEHHAGDKCAAVRRAIVRRAAEDARAAASIGRGLATNPDSEKP